MSFPYLTHDTFCLTLAHSIDDADLVEKLLMEYPQDTEACMTSALQQALSMPSQSSRKLFDYLTVLWQKYSLERKLRIAVDRGLTYLLVYLISRGADVHKDDDWPFTNAVYSNNMVAVKILLSARANVHARNEMALVSALSNNNPDMFKLLIEHKADPLAREQDTPLTWAARNGNDEIVKLLLDMGVNVNPGNSTTGSDNPLKMAAESGHTSTVKLLISCRADTTHHRGVEALFAAANGQHLDIMKLLLDSNATPMAGDVLVRVAERGGSDVIKFLLDYRADVHTSEDAALIHAISYGREADVRILLEHKANVHAQRDKPLRSLNYGCVSNAITDMVRARS